METPRFEENIERQNDVYAMEIVEQYRDKPKSPDNVLKALSYSFILGAGGYEGCFDAAMVLEEGGLALLLQKVELAYIYADPNAVVDEETFAEAVRAAVAHGAQYDVLEMEIPRNSLSDGEITGQIFGPLAKKFTWDPNEPRPSQSSDWLHE